MSTIHQTEQFTRAKASRSTRFRIALLAILVMLVGGARGEVVTEHYLKGVFLYNFARLTDWPSTSRQGDSFDICVIARSDVVDEIRAALSGKTIANTPVVTRRVKDSKSTKGCRVLFLDGEAGAMEKDLSAGVGILTVGEDNDFLHKGGIVRFVNVDGHLSFDVSVAQAQHQGIKLSSRLLSVARRVE